MIVEAWTVDHKKLSPLTRRMQDVLGAETQSEYRVGSQSVTLFIGKQNTEIRVRDNMPNELPNGKEFYPYTALGLQPRPNGKVFLRELMGAQIRDRHGLLVEFPPKKPQSPQAEQFSRKDLKKLQKNPGDPFEYYPDLKYYEDLAANLDPNNRHDIYGRTTEEQEREERVVSEFQEITDRLYTQWFNNSGWNPPPPSIYRGAGMGGHIPIPPPEPFSCIISGGDRLSVYPFGPRIDIVSADGVKRTYIERPMDHRLGVTVYRDNKKAYNNPVNAFGGEALIKRLKRVNL